MTEDGSLNAAATEDEASRQLVRLLDGYAASQIARVLALLGVPG